MLKEISMSYSYLIHQYAWHFILIKDLVVNIVAPFPGNFETLESYAQENSDCYCNRHPCHRIRHKSIRNKT